MSQPADGSRTRTAAVTGAASGIGRVYCRKLAADGFDLIVIDRQEAGLAALREELATSHPRILILACVADLAEEAGLGRIEAILALETHLDVIVIGAGFGTYGPFASSDLEVQVDMVRLHVISCVRLCRTVMPGMIRRNSGAIIAIASMAAFTRFPGQATYTGTKAFIVAFLECLRAELDQAGAGGVRTQALCAGNTRTAFNSTERMGALDVSRIPSFLWMTPEQVVDQSLARLARGSGTFIPSFRNRLLVLTVANPLSLRILAGARRIGLLEGILRLLKGRSPGKQAPPGPG
jgi:short-subunit dehydrogenase